MNTIEQFNALKADWRKKQEELRKEGQEILFKSLKELFEKNENLEEISWTQYTPWFNDGDTCEFSTYATSPTVNGWEENSWDYYAEGREKVSDELYRQILTILNILDEEDYKEIFGDHVKVTITKEGYEVEEYDHD